MCSPAHAPVPVSNVLCPLSGVVGTQEGQECRTVPAMPSPAGLCFEQLGARLQPPPSPGIPLPLLCHYSLAKDPTTSFSLLVLVVKVNAGSTAQLQSKISVT